MFELSSLNHCSTGISTLTMKPPRTSGQAELQLRRAIPGTRHPLEASLFFPNGRLKAFPASHCCLRPRLCFLRPAKGRFRCHLYHLDLACVASLNEMRSASVCNSTWWHGSMLPPLHSSLSTTCGTTQSRSLPRISLLTGEGSRAQILRGPLQPAQHPAEICR